MQQRILPTPVPGTTTTTGSPTLYQSTNETLNYEVAQTENHQIIHPGMVENVSLSVLVDGVSDQQQLQTLQAAISAAAGINQTRGDQLSVQTLTFDKTYLDKQTQDLASADQTRLFTMIAEIIGGLLVLGALFWYINRLLKNLRVASVEVWDPVLKPFAEMGLSSISRNTGVGLHQAVINHLPCHLLLSRKAVVCCRKQQPV